MYDTYLLTYLPSPLLAVPNVTAHLLTASVPITVLLYDGPLLFGFYVAIRRLKSLEFFSWKEWTFWEANKSGEAQYGKHGATCERGKQKPSLSLCVLMMQVVTQWVATLKKLFWGDCGQFSTTTMLSVENVRADDEGITRELCTLERPSPRCCKSHADCRRRNTRTINTCQDNVVHVGELLLVCGLCCNKLRLYIYIHFLRISLPPLPPHGHIRDVMLV